MSILRSLKYSRVLFSAVLCISSLSKIMASSDLVKGNERFGKNLYNIVSREEGNLICSPISAHIVLSMAAAGAEGDTKKALLTTLGLNSPMDAATGYESFLTDVEKAKSKVTLDLANKIFIMKSFTLKSEFNNIMKKNYKSEAQELDFAQSAESANTINSWVESKTNNKIKNLIQPSSLTSDTRLVLVNAIYFKGNWAKQFRPENTMEESFYLLDGSEVKCNMMHISGKYGYMEDDKLKAKILKMDYTDESMSMLFFLPNERDGLKHLEENIQNFDFQNYKQNLGSWEVDVAIPRFKIESEIKLTEILKKMGLQVMFDNGADFSNISENGEQLKVSEVIQKAMIEVNEEGAEAAAATASVMRLKRSINLTEKKKFMVDKPFMFIIINSHQNITMFAGKVMKPVFIHRVHHEEL